MTDWSINPIFGSYSIIVLVAFCLMAVLLLVRESGRLTRMQWFTLWSLRLSMCLVLLLFMLRPGITFTTQSSPSGTIAILMDDSPSMSMGSGDAKQTRWEQQLDVLRKIWNRRESLGANNVWSVFAYSNNLRPVATAKSGQSVELALPDQPAGFITDVGGPISQLMGASLEAPLSAVVWMGDGSQTLSPSGGDPLQMARRLMQLDIPLYVIGIGPRADSDNARDLSLEGVPEQLDVFSKNAINLLGSLRCRGVANQELFVRISLRNDANAPQELARVRLRPTRNDETLPFQLKLIAPDPGAYEIVVEAIPVEREAVLQNNISTTYLNVRAGGARVLYIEGEARYEMKFIRRALGDSPDIDIYLLPINKPPVQKWPVDLKEQLSGDVFDCILLGDVDFNAFGPEGANRIAEMVRTGAGLITLGGYHTYGPGGWGSSALRDVLPVQIAGGSRTSIDGKINLQDQIDGPLQVIPKGNPEMLQIDVPERNGETWKQLPPLLGATKWSGIKNNGAVLLAESQKGDPLIVAGNAGEGRVLALAIDSTFVWARQGKVNAHKEFWRKLIYWAMRRKSVEQGLEMRMAQRRLMLGQSSEVIVDWIPGSSNEEMPKNISMHLWKMPDDGRDQGQDLGEIATSRRDSGSLRAAFACAKNAGRYEWRAQATAGSGKVIESKLPFLVADRSLESLQPIPDWQLMEQMAKLNASAGGALLAPEQTSNILEQLQERRKQATENVVENRKLGEGLLDSWTSFLVLGGLMITQWGLRKKWNLP